MYIYTVLKLGQKLPLNNDPCNYFDPVAIRRRITIKLFLLISIVLFQYGYMNYFFCAMFGITYCHLVIIFMCNLAQQRKKQLVYQSAVSI